MPSFQRLLVLAVLGMTMYTQAAPVLVSSGTDVQVAAPVERELAPYNFEDESLDARDFDVVDDDAEEDDDTEDESEVIHARAVKKAAKVAAKPKVVKPKATAKPKVAAKPKTPVKAKTVAKPKVAAKTKVAAKPKATAKPKTAVKPKVAAKPAATKATKVAAKTAKATAKPSATPAAGAACALKPKTKTAAKPKKAAARAYDFIAHLFRRDGPEFVGWHGTNSDTAAFWAKQGQLEKPPAKTGFFDFNLFGPKTGTAPGTSGADAEIGPGVYVTDDQDIAVAFANNNAKVNAGTTAQLCAIFAKSEANWRTAIRKAFIPETLVGDSSNPVTKKTKEDARLAHIKKAVPGVSAPDVIKFSLLNRSTKTGQLVLPARLTNQFTAKCVAASEAATVAGASKFPAFSYNGATLRSEWNIAAETAGECA